MKYQLNVNQQQAIELGITHINQALIFDLLTTVASWAETIVIDNEVFYWVSRQTISSELKLLGLKNDTVYRNFKKLDNLGLINYKKYGKKDCIRITKLGKKYLLKPNENTMSDSNPNHYAGNKSEKEVKLESKSEKNSDLNPTYPLTNKIIEEDERKKEQLEIKFHKYLDLFIQWLKQENNIKINNLFSYKKTLIEKFQQGQEKIIFLFDEFLKSKFFIENQTLGKFYQNKQIHLVEIKEESNIYYFQLFDTNSKKMNITVNRNKIDEFISQLNSYD
ncbi:hypothetical protein [Halarcobacter anaerophilus]|uniref:hypothetical protein n=1 Tax=Halarcobacter anaerophilus TaxID=877500 RepID=UPI0005C9B255|nr:hypothetical protein [Halarcobacter anaerophilus]